MIDTRYIHLPDIEDGGAMESIDIATITAIKEPTEYTDGETGEIYEIDPGSPYAEVFFRDGKRLCSIKTQLSVADIVKIINK